MAEYTLKVRRYQPESGEGPEPGGGSRLIGIYRHPADPRLAQALELPEGAEVLQIERLLMPGGGPTGVERLYVDGTRFDGPEGPQALFSGRILPFDEQAALAWASIMAEGTLVLPQHYATFHHALVEITSISEWALGPKTAKPTPAGTNGAPPAPAAP